MDTPQNTNITVIPTGAALGADVVGVDLSKPLSQETFRQIEDAWHSHLVLRFRGQKLDDPALLAFGQRFGELDSAPIHAGKDVVNPFPQITVMSNIKVDGKPIGNLGHYEAVWHTDMSYNDLAPIGSLLYSLEIPPAGGNTGFSNMYKAYDALPADLKIRLAGKKALHIHEYERSAKVELRDDLSKSAHFFHPVFSTHAETGRKSLFVDRLMTARLEGLPKEENESLLEQLYEIGERPEFIYEHKWQLGDFVMWDNRCAIHARTWFPPEERRLLRRCAIEGAPIHE
jgi:taurine dioxygenase